MQVAVALFPKVTVLDAIGPYQVFAGMPDAEVVFCAAQAGRVTDAKGSLHIDVEHSFEDVPRPDVLLIPGGNVTRDMTSGHPILDWVRSAHEHTTHHIGLHRLVAPRCSGPVARAESHHALGCL